MNETVNNVQSKDDETDQQRSPVCRLRHGLNENCLLHVFEYLGESDLKNLCSMDSYYKELILKWTIKQKRLNLPGANNLEWFKVFGKSMRKIKLYSGQFITTITTIMKYCEPGQLTEIDLSIQDGGGLLKRADVTDSLLQLTLQAMPYFSNLRKLRFEAYCDADMRGACTNFLTQISTAALNLRSVEISQLELRGNWLENIRNLGELRIKWKIGSSFDSLFSFLNGKPNLKVFKLIHQLSDVTSVYDCLAESCSNLETFSDEDRTLSTHYRHFDDSLTSRYAFFSKFSHLSYVTLTTYTFCGSDLYYPLVNLATKNLIKLTVATSLSEPILLSNKVKTEIMRRPLPQFSRLKTVKFDLSTPSVHDFDEKLVRCDLRCQFLFHFLRQVTSLQQFELYGPSSTHMYKIVEHLPTIRVLDLSQSHSFEIFKDVTNIVKTVLRSPFRGAGIFHLILKDDEKVQFFKKQNDLKDRINFTFTTRNRWDR
ncbi:hypothetical protein HA402_002311 [Bradysia odoriphaga]|nr:hypothetical protein HA402_002311 [Bradysia odoriphaga]